MKRTFILIAFLMFSKCNIRNQQAFFPGSPTNLREINSVWDDVNSDSPYTPHFHQLIFSTNRPTANGTSFGLVGYDLNFNWDRKEGFLSLNTKSLSGKRLADLVLGTLSEGNEKGPYSFMESDDNMGLFFSRDVDGIYSIHVVTEKPVPPLNAKSLPYFRILDQSSNEMYPSFYGKEFEKGNPNGDGTPEKILFSSDRDGQFDIYEIDIPSGMTPLQYLADTSPKEVKKLMINTDSNDHMPFVFGDLLVFASDRPGGIGRYDLYYSRKTADGWSSPVNFGPSINSTDDEYRPIVSDGWTFQNNLMIFSSNRPGGKGGFDLYYVGIPK
jgi:hypothetical protein